VERDEILCEIATDKIDTDVPSPASGTVVELLVEVDQTVPVGTPLARIALAQAGSGGAEQPAEGTPSSPPNGRAEPAARRGHSPVVARIAAEHGIDLAAIRGSGRGGRVRKQDVLAAVDAQAVAAPTTEGGVGQPLSRMRRAIAEHMTSSLRTAAHCTTIVEADFSRVQRTMGQAGGSPLPFVARAVVRALQRHPVLNCTFEGERMVRHEEVNLGIAVSLGEAGLIVPVIHGAQELSREGLAARIRELAARARAGALEPDDVSGGTFTITNPGSFGSIASTPIINQPQVAILDLEAVVRRAVVVAGDDGEDAIAIRPMACLCLSWDHRALDGALAAKFLATVRAQLEERDDLDE
jgi:2-oxoglutarate dehydrogenase E2 component (dihydrolipoamide succinyltransferase)